eukprot:767817_1
MKPNAIDPSNDIQHDTVESTNNADVAPKSIHLRSQQNHNETGEHRSEERQIQTPTKTDNTHPINSRTKRIQNQFHCCECMQYMTFIVLFTITAIISRSIDSSNYRIT